MTDAELRGQDSVQEIKRKPKTGNENQVIKSSMTDEDVARNGITWTIKDQLTIVIPTLDEEKAIGPLLEEIRQAGYSNILVVDGYSKDSTVDIAQASGVQVVFQHGIGKAGALVTAFEIVNTPYLIVMDGDGTYDPKDIERFLPLLGDYAYVKGIRAKTNISRLHRIGNYIISKSFDMLFGTNIGDICSGMYTLKVPNAKALSFEKHHLTVEQELAAQIASSGARITTVPINYRKRFGGESKTNTWRQGFRDLITNFDLALSYNPIFLFALLATLSLIPATILLLYAAYLYFAFRVYHGGYFLGSLMLFVIGGQGFTVATIGIMLRRVDRKLNNYLDETQ